MTTEQELKDKNQDLILAIRVVDGIKVTTYKYMGDEPEDTSNVRIKDGCTPIQENGVYNWGSYSTKFS